MKSLLVFPWSVDGPSAAMARDEALAALPAAGDDRRHAARAHDWAEPTLSIGRTQPVPADLPAQARAAGVALVRRPTGGGWLLHLPGDLSLTFVDGGPLGPGALRGTARRTAQALAAALGATGRSALVLTGAMMQPSRAEVCFERADRDEVVAGETKVAGVALARLGRAALVQTAVPLTAPRGPVAAFAARWDPRRAAAQGLLEGLPAARLAHAALDALAAALQATVEDAAWNGAVMEVVARLVRERYGDERFTLEPRGAGR